MRWIIMNDYFKNQNKQTNKQTIIVRTERSAWVQPSGVFDGQNAQLP